MAKVCQLFSGSSGNAIFLANGETKILIDAGVSAKRLEEGLSQIGESADSLSAVFITHEHIDHVNGLRVLAARHHIPVFASETILPKLYADSRLNAAIHAEPIQTNMELNGIEILPFALSHDSLACYGYRFNLPNGKSVSVCTDTGYIPAPAKEILSGSEMIFLEFNHEITMLQNSTYTYMLKQRILSERGHLSNEDAAAFAAELAQTGTQRFMLSHLSKENNHPEIARQTALSALKTAGLKEETDFRLTVATPVNAERAIIL